VKYKHCPALCARRNTPASSGVSFAFPQIGKYAVSMKVDNRVFAYLSPRRQHYVVSTFDSEDRWKDYPVKTDDDLEVVLPLMSAAMARRSK
jgi:hypothetical protein